MRKENTTSLAKIPAVAHRPGAHRTQPEPDRVVSEGWRRDLILRIFGPGFFWGPRGAKSNKEKRRMEAMGGHCANATARLLEGAAANALEVAHQLVPAIEELLKRLPKRNTPMPVLDPRVAMTQGFAWFSSAFAADDLEKIEMLSGTLGVYHRLYAVEDDPRYFAVSKLAEFAHFYVLARRSRLL